MQTLGLKISEALAGPLLPYHCFKNSGDLAGLFILIANQTFFKIFLCSYLYHNTHTPHPSASTTHLRLFSIAFLKEGFSDMPSRRQLLRRGAEPCWSPRLQAGTSPHFIGWSTLSPRTPSTFVASSEASRTWAAFWMWACSLEISTGLENGRKVV